MKIGIDIDGVLTDIEQWQLDYGSKFYYENYGLGIKNYKGYETNEIFDVDIKLDDEFWNKYFREYSINLEARKFANEVIDKLKEDGHEIYIITARGSFLSHLANVMTIEENRNIVLNWLKINQRHYDNIIFSPEDKFEICKENNISIMIEDKVENINNISKIIPVVCFNAAYNKECNGKNIFRAYTWYDVYRKIKEIF